MIAALKERMAARGEDIPIQEILCFGRCEQGANLRIVPGGAFFHRAARRTQTPSSTPPWPSAKSKTTLIYN